MRKYVIDANILFAGIISNKRIYIDITKNFDLYAPSFVLTEIEKYEELLLLKTRLTKKDLDQFVIELFKGVTILPSILMNDQAKQRAVELCRDIDEKDTPYVALAIEMEIPLITNDKKLYRGLRAKGFTHILLLEDLLSEITE